MWATSDDSLKINHVDSKNYIDSFPWISSIDRPGLEQPAVTFLLGPDDISMFTGTSSCSKVPFSVKDKCVMASGGK